MALDLDTIEDRLRVLSDEPGPWKACECGKCGLIWAADREHLAAAVSTSVDGEPMPGFAKVASFLAHARTDVPALVARVRELEKIHTVARRLMAAIDADRIGAAQIADLRTVLGDAT